VLQDGEFFGEIALLSNVPRTASVRALTPCLLLSLARKDFHELLQRATGLRATVEQLAAQRMEIVAAHRAMRRSRPRLGRAVARVPRQQRSPPGAQLRPDGAGWPPCWPGNDR
jgi:CRP-like cAMP-binding protein